MGPWSYVKHLTSGARLPFTAAYFGSIALTLYFAIGVSKSIYYVVYFFCHPKKGRWILHFCTSAGYVLSRSTPSYLMILHFLVRRTLLYPHTKKYGCTAQPGRGEFCSLRIHRIVQPEFTACRARPWPQPF
jgi:hypothetical protein